MTTLTIKEVTKATGLDCNREQLAALKAEQKRIHFSLNAYEQYLRERVERYGVLTMDEQHALNKKSTKATADEGESLAQQLTKQKLNSFSKKANDKKQEESKRDEMLKKQADALKKAEADSKKENKKNNKKSTKALTFGEVAKRYAELEKKQVALLKELKAIEAEMAEINEMTLK